LETLLDVCGCKRGSLVIFLGVVASSAARTDQSPHEHEFSGIRAPKRSAPRPHAGLVSKRELVLVPHGPQPPSFSRTHESWTDPTGPRTHPCWPHRFVGGRLRATTAAKLGSDCAGPTWRSIVPASDSPCRLIRIFSNNTVVCLMQALGTQRDRARGQAASSPEAVGLGASFAGGR